MPGTIARLIVSTDSVNTLESVIDSLRECIPGILNSIDGVKLEDISFSNQLTPNEQRVFDSIQINRICQE